MKIPAIIALVAASGCERNLLHGLPDAPLPDSPPACPAPATPLAAGKHLIYLNTEGVTLAYSASPDSRTNTTDLVVPTGATVPPFLSMMAGRQEFIAAIVQTVTASLTAYSIDVVTVRPSGDYYMFVLGGDSATITGGGSNQTSVSDFHCAVLGPDTVDLIFDLGSDSTHPPEFYASEVLADLGLMAGMAPTNADDDCECRIDNCTWKHLPCTYGTNVPTTMQLSGSGAPLNCGRAPTQDETALLEAQLGCR